MDMFVIYLVLSGSLFAADSRFFVPGETGKKLLSSRFSGVLGPAFPGVPDGMGVPP